MADHEDDRIRKSGSQEALTATSNPGSPAAGDTIAAIATAAGRGGVGIVRVSGRGLAVFAQEMLGHAPVPRMAHRSMFLDASGRAIDDGLSVFFPAPRSYTGEDVLELQGHGGPVVLRMVLARCIELGARLAEPGEFTRRAFLNDKLDLAQAEAVADLIEAASESAARCALRSLQGEFSSAVSGLAALLLDLRMLVEAMLDFPEEDVDVLDREDAARRLQRLESELARAMTQARRGSLLRSGICAVIAGQPNVGKSSLLNCLSGEELAIVTPYPGTTRDALRQAIQIDGVPITLVDTAGLRETEDLVETIGIERTWAALEKADVVMLVVDARSGVAVGDEALAGRVPGKAARITVFNKIDLLDAGTEISGLSDAAAVGVSAKTGEGLDRLREKLLEAAGWERGGEDVFIARDRHIEALASAADSLQRSRKVILQPELFAEELRLAHQALGSITGQVSADDLLGEIFSRFCIGK